MKNFYSSLDKDSINLKNLSERDTMYNHFDKQQKDFFHSIQDNIFTYCEATSGSGKTITATAAMLDLLANGNIDHIVYVRYADDRSKSIGYFPGTLEEKTCIYWAPLYDALEELGFTPEMIQLMENEEMLQESLDISMRGINLKRCGVIVDEVQNFEVEDLRLVFTRNHDSNHIAAIGDGRQKDNKKASDSYKAYCEYLANSSIGKKVELVNNYRGLFSKLAENYHA